MTKQCRDSRGEGTTYLRRIKRLGLLFLLTFTVAAGAADPLASFVGEFTARHEEGNHTTGEWSSRPMTLTGRPIAGGKFVELRGTFRFHGFEKPIELVFLWSFDPFQKRIRAAVLDDFVGLLDVFEQEQTSPLRVSNVRHGTYFPDEKGRRGHLRFTIHDLGRGVIRIEQEGSVDGGKSWTPGSRLTMIPKGIVKTGPRILRGPFPNRTTGCRAAPRPWSRPRSRCRRRRCRSR